MDEFLACSDSEHLTPRTEHLSEWKQDYHAMGDMFFGDAPDYDTLLLLVDEFEKRFNHGSAL